MPKPSILFCASEVYPFAKTGGLADVAHSLPKALSDAYSVQVVLPLYQSIDRGTYNIQSLGKTFCVELNNSSYEIALFHCIYETIEYIFISSPLLCEREYLYGTPTYGYEDNALRFSIFNHAIFQLIKENRYDIVHLNDWQTALVPVLLETNKDIKTKTIFTIHNLAFQGVFPYEMFNQLGIDEKYFSMESLEFYGQINFLKGAIAYSDVITTVSPNYAKEILTAEFGCGLEGFLSYHKNKLFGVLNGLDGEHFTPKNDKLITYPFSNLTEKNAIKKEFLQECGLKGITKPLFVFIGRLTHQKGVELLIESLEDIVKLPCNIAILGDGDEKYQNQIKALQNENSNLYCAFAFNEKRSHQMYASADFFLMPSLFEPCGLTQMIAMAYGAIPIVHNVGGLKDSVQSVEKFDKKSLSGYGIVFESPTYKTFFEATKKAQKLYETKKEYNKIVKHNMQCDFSWAKSAIVYKQIFTQILKENK